MTSAQIIYVYTNSQGRWEICSFFLSFNYSLLTLCFFFKFYFIFKLYIIASVLPNIKMNPPQVYMWGGRREEGSGWGTHVYY